MCKCFLNFIAKFYRDNGEQKIFKEGILIGTKKLAKSILENSMTKKEKINFIMNMLSGFGWGIPFYKNIKGKITFAFIYPPISRHGFLYEATVLNGYLNYIFNKN